MAVVVVVVVVMVMCSGKRAKRETTYVEESSSNRIPTTSEVKSSISRRHPNPSKGRRNLSLFLNIKIFKSTAIPILRTLHSYTCPAYTLRILIVTSVISLVQNSARDVVFRFKMTSPVVQ